MRALSQLGGRTLDKQLLYQFNRCMGVYPVGTLVEFSNGRLGVVIAPEQTRHTGCTGILQYAPPPTGTGGGPLQSTD